MVKLLKCLPLSGGKNIPLPSDSFGGATTLIAEPGLLCVFLPVPESLAGCCVHYRFSKGHLVLTT